MSLSDRVSDELFRRIPEGRRGWVVLVILLCGALWTGRVWLQNGDLKGEVANLKLRLAPFEAAAIKAFPGEEQTAAIKKLGEQLGQVASEFAAKKEQDLNAQIENAYVEVVRNGWSLKDLADLTPAAMRLAHPETTASAALAANTTLDRQTRTLLGLYVTDMNEAAVRFSTLSDSCGRGQIAEQNVETAKRAAVAWQEKSAQLKRRLENVMETRGVTAPVVELASDDGKRGVCVQ